MCTLFQILLQPWALVCAFLVCEGPRAKNFLLPLTLVAGGSFVKFALLKCKLLFKTVGFCCASLVRDFRT